MLRTQIAKDKIPGHPPAAPGGTPLLPGQGDTRGVPRDPDVGPRILKIPLPWGGSFDFRTGPTSNSQAIADEYGDTAQEPYGWYRALVDVSDNISRALPPEEELNKHNLAAVYGQRAGAWTRKQFDDFWAARAAYLKSRRPRGGGGW